MLPAFLCLAAPLFAGMTAIDTLDGTQSDSYGVSGDGSVIAGARYLASGDIHGFIYANGTMTDIGTLGGTQSSLMGLSSDGSIAAGYSLLAGGEGHAIKYANGTMTDLGTLGGTNSYAVGISGDGSILVGYSGTTGGLDTHAFKYTTGGGMIDLGSLGGSNSSAGAISSDGSVIVGDSEITGNAASHAFKYTAADGMTDIGTLGGTSSMALGVNSNGSIIVGESQTTGNAGGHAFKYTAADGMTDLGTLGGTWSYAYGVSDDGSVIVGESRFDNTAKTHAFKYTGGRMIDIGTLGGDESMAEAVSSDGGTIIGTSFLAGDTEQHAFIYRSIIVDANNTVQAIANNAGQMNSLLNLKSSLLVNALDSDCAMYSDKGICLALTGWHYSGQESALAAQSATTLKASYRFSKNFRAGALMDLAFAQTNPDNFNVSKAPLFGGFAAYGDNATGNGIQVRIAAAYNEADATITRTVLANTEAGQGESTFNSFGAKAEAGYGKTLAGWRTLPYLGVQWTNVSRNAYGETSGATFPVVYNAIGQRQFTALAGIKTDKMIAAGFGLNGGIGVEQDINNSVDGYTGTMDTLGSFNLARPHMNWTRPFANVGASYELAKNQRIGAGLSVRRQTLTNTYGTLVSGQYTIAF